RRRSRPGAPRGGPPSHPTPLVREREPSNPLAPPGRWGEVSGRWPRQVMSRVTHEIKSASTPVGAGFRGPILPADSGMDAASVAAADGRRGRVTRESPSFDAVHLGARQLDEPRRVLRQQRPLGLAQAEPVVFVLPRADDVLVRHDWLPRPSIPLSSLVARRVRVIAPAISARGSRGPPPERRRPRPRTVEAP